MITDVNLTHGTSRTMMSKPLKRGLACMNCRFLKIKCDGIKPICGPCRKHPKDDECEYSDGPERSRTKALEDTVLRLEARLHELEHPEDATPSVTLYDPYAPQFPPQLTISPSYPSSSRSLPNTPYHQQRRMHSPAGSPLSSSPGSQEYTPSSPFSSPSPRATTPPFGTYGRRSSPLGIFDSRVITTPESTSSSLESDWSLCEVLLQTFRPHASEFGFFLHWSRFFQSTMHPVLPDGTIHNSSALLNTLYMWGAHLSSDRQREVYFKTKALQSVAADLTPQSFLHTLQAEVLLSHFFFRTGHFLEARTHTATAVALALGTGLHQIRSLNHPDAPVIEITEENDQEIHLRPSADAIEEGERINGFWAVFMLQKNLSVALEPPARVCGVFEAGGMQIDTPWPLEMDDYKQGLLTSDIHGDSTVLNFLRQISTPSYHERPSITTLNVKACILLHRAVYMHGQYRPNVPEREAQSWWTAFGVVEQLINSLRSELPDPLVQLQVQGRSPGSARTILLTHSLLNAATIKLHSIFYTDPTSRQNCLAAARDMFRFGGTNPQGLGYLNPMMGTLWMTACSVFIDELRQIRATAESAPGAWPLQIASEAEREKEMLGSLHDGLDALSAFARESLLMRHQLTKVQESMGAGPATDGLARWPTETLEYRAQHLENMSRLSRFPERQPLPPVTRYEPYPRLPSRHRSPRNHYGSSRASSLGGFSDAGSEYESHGSSSQREWNLPSYDLPAHQLILKELDLTGQITKSGIYPSDCGSAADIYHGVLNPPPTDMLNRPPAQFVAVKIFRHLHSESQNLKQICTSLYEEARIWKNLDHPNISPFLGIALDLGLSPALISPLFPSGPIMRYLRHNAKDPQEKLKMTIGVADGLAYLHSQDIVHGNLCTKKVLIDGHGAPVICGYGIYKALRQPANAASLLSAPIRFAAPECFSDEVGMTSVRTMSRDVYAFSMVMLEILSGLEPYHHLPAEHVIFEHIHRGDRPIRNIQAVTDPAWRLLTSLWNQNPSLRPSMSDTVSCLVQIRDEHSKMDIDSDNIQPEATSPPDEKDDKTSSGEETNFEDPDIRGRDLKGCIKQDDPYPFASGGNSNIYRGKLSRSGGTKIRIAIKMIRVSDDGSGQLQDILRRLRREADVWSRLKHKNILPFIGVCEDLAGAPTPVLISPFYKSGHVGIYLRKHPKSNRKELVRGVASGLEFLHANEIVHGDLKVQNVLVNKRGVPCICDFGISKILSRRGFTTSSVGTAPYMAPELFIVIDGPAHEQPPSTTQSSDVYSFALLALEILTSEAPKRRPSKTIVTAEILAQLHPRRADYDIGTVTNATWSVLTRCWSFEPQLRPPIAEVLGELTAVFT